MRIDPFRRLLLPFNISLPLCFSIPAPVFRPENRRHIRRIEKRLWVSPLVFSKERCYLYSINRKMMNRTWNHD